MGSNYFTAHAFVCEYSMKYQEKKKLLSASYAKYVGQAQRYLERNPEMRDIYTNRMLARKLQLKAIKRWYSSK